MLNVNVTLSCNACGMVLNGTTKQEVTREAKERKWLFRGEEHFCESCRVTADKRRQKRASDPTTIEDMILGFMG